MSKSNTIKWVYDDGGREAAGRKGKTRDCVTRAISIVFQRPYMQVYNDINEEAGNDIAENGVERRIYEAVIRSYGGHWTPTMSIGSGCKVHLRPSELPSGRLIARCSRHLVAVIDGVIHDTFDPRRDEKRCVYGYFSRATR